MITRILHFKDLKAIPISLASLAEQRRIVAMLRVNVLILTVLASAILPEF